MSINELQEHAIHCPHCDESITVLIDSSIPQQTYVEDCQVCCRPIVLDIDIGMDGEARVSARPENE